MEHAIKRILSIWDMEQTLGEHQTLISINLVCSNYVFSMSGKYFLQTHGNVFNLSKGPNGIRPTKVQVTRLRVPTNNYAPLPVPTMLEDDIYF